MLVNQVFFLAFFAMQVWGRESSLHEMRLELRQAELALTKAVQRVTAIQEAIAKKEIAGIRKDLQEIQELIAEKVIVEERFQEEDLFAGHRETLVRIIEQVPACALEAQGVLDQILSLITLLSDAIIDD